MSTCDFRQFLLLRLLLLVSVLLTFVYTNAFIITQSTSTSVQRNSFLQHLLVDTKHRIWHTRQRQYFRYDNNKMRLHESSLSASSSSSSSSSSSQTQLEELVNDFTKSFDLKEITKTCKVKIGVVDGKRLGLIATEKLSKGEVALSIPYDDRYELRADIAKSQSIFGQYITDEYYAWTSDVGYIALLVLNELAIATGAGGIPIPNRSQSISDFMKSWIQLLPSSKELSHHPLLWNENDQEILQSSSTNKIYKKLDDIEDDITWLIDNVFATNRERFPETVTLHNDQQIGCFNLDGFRWANAIVLSRSYFLDGKIRLIPIIDMCNHSDDSIEEVQDGKFGPFFATKGVQLVSSTVTKVGEEVFVSYGPKSAADYLLEYGFIPDSCWYNAICEITIEVDDTDRFYDDKIDILEYDTYDQAPMSSIQKFDIVCTSNRDGEPDRAMIQFLRLCKLCGTDSFLLESIFRKDVWDFMSLPVSEQNELLVLNEIITICENIINNDFNQGVPSTTTTSISDSSTSGDSVYEICTRLRELETKALVRTINYIQREKQAVDLKEFYQERRLKDLGLDSAWNRDSIDNNDSEIDNPSFGQTRRPGTADYDW